MANMLSESGVTDWRVDRATRVLYRCTRKGLFIVLLLSVGSLGLAACSSKTAAHPAAAPRSSQAVSLQVFPGTLVDLTTYAAQQEGFFAQNGIKATLVPIGTATGGAAALEAGSIQVATGSPDGLLPLIAKGYGAKIISGATKQIFQLIVSKSVAIHGSYPADLAALKGKTVGVPALGTAAMVIVEAMLKQAGINPKAVTFVPVGAAATALAAIEHGGVDALSDYPPVTTTPVLSGKARLLVNLAVPGQGPPGVAGGDYVAYWAMSNYISSHSGVIAKLRRSFAQAALWLANPNNTANVRSLVHSIVGSSVPPSQVASFVKATLPTYDLASYAPSAASLWDRFDVKYGFIKKLIPISSFYSTGTPATPGDVQKLAS